MILSFKTKFKKPGTPIDGKPTHFKELILGYDWNNSIIIDDKVRLPKLHTIREDKPNRWHEGLTIHMAYGHRTKQYDQFNKGHDRISTVTGIQAIRIEHVLGPTVGMNTNYFYNHAYQKKHQKAPGGVTMFHTCKMFIDDVEMSIDQMKELAVNDGFESLDNFFDWFSEPFVGKIIHWTDITYGLPSDKIGAE
jgi:hypothetical protein